MPDTRRRGFTLIELLVVIAIIAILAAILFPVFAAARKSALQTQCLSNMKQLDTAMFMYADDSDGHLMTYLFYSELLNNAGTSVNGGIGNKYVRSVDVFRCPMDDMKRWDGSHYYKGTYSYSINGFLEGMTPRNYGTINQDSLMGRKYGWFQEPARTPTFVEEGSVYDPNLTDPTHTYWGINDARMVNGDQTGIRHNGRSSLAYLDGHVKAQKGLLVWNVSRNDDNTYWCCPPYQ